MLNRDAMLDLKGAARVPLSAMLASKPNQPRLRPPLRLERSSPLDRCGDRRVRLEHLRAYELIVHGDAELPAEGVIEQEADRRPARF